MDLDPLLGEVDRIIAGGGTGEGKLADICDLLRRRVPYYDWVGFYRVVPGKKELVLGPFSGEPTEHVVIPFGRGVCGRAASGGETLTVPDVSKEGNYLACSSKVRSEIVVPIWKKGSIVGELDIDSYTLAAFSRKDREFLEKVGEMVTGLI